MNFWNQCGFLPQRVPLPDHSFIPVRQRSDDHRRHAYFREQLCEFNESAEKLRFLQLTASTFPFEVCIKYPFRKQDYLINIIYVAKKGKKLNGQRQQVFNLTEAEVMSNLPSLIVAPTCFRDQMRTAKKKVKGAFLSVLSFLPPLSDSSLDETRQRSSIIAVCVKLIVQFLVNLWRLLNWTNQDQPRPTETNRDQPRPTGTNRDQPRPTETN